MHDARFFPVKARLDKPRFFAQSRRQMATGYPPRPAMVTTVQQFRERLFNAKQSSRRQSASDPFFEKLEHVQPPGGSFSQGALSSAVLRVGKVREEFTIQK